MTHEISFEDQMQAVTRYAEGKLLAGLIGNAGILLFNQPDKRNAISLEMWEALGDALERFTLDSEVRVLIYAGAGGKAFTSGNDISQFATRRNNAEDNLAFTRITGEGRRRMTAFPKPSIACVQGYCMGGGLGMAMQADLRVAAHDAVFGIPAARLGIAYAPEPLERLVALVGPAQARLMLYTARRFSGQEAFAMGLVEVLASQDAVSEALELAQVIAENAPLSIQAARFNLEQLQKPPADRDTAASADLTRRCMDSSDYREGRAAFREKRKPLFTGS